MLLCDGWEVMMPRADAAGHAGIMNLGQDMSTERFVTYCTTNSWLHRGAPKNQTI